jgi:hypothetical protein
MMRLNRTGAVDILLSILFIVVATGYAAMVLAQSEMIQKREMDTLNGIHNFYPAETSARAFLYETLGLDLKGTPPSSHHEEKRPNLFESLFSVATAYASPPSQSQSNDERQPPSKENGKSKKTKFVRTLKGPKGDVTEYCSVGTSPGIGKTRQLCVAVLKPAGGPCTSPVTWKGGCWRAPAKGRNEGYSCNEICADYGGPKDTLVTPDDCKWIASGFNYFGQYNKTFAELTMKPVLGPPCFMVICGARQSSACFYFSTVVDHNARWWIPMCDCNR